MELVVLFSNGSPTVYEVYQSKGRFYFTPMRSLNNDATVQVFILEQVDGGWKAEGTQDIGLLDQAVAKIEKLVF